MARGVSAVALELAVSSPRARRVVRDEESELAVAVVSVCEAGAY